MIDNISKRIITDIEANNLFEVSEEIGDFCNRFISKEEIKDESQAVFLHLVTKNECLEMARLMLTDVILVDLYYHLKIEFFPYLVNMHVRTISSIEFDYENKRIVLIVDQYA